VTRAAALALSLLLAGAAPGAGPEDAGTQGDGTTADGGAADGGGTDPDAEVIENLDLLERLDLLEHLDWLGPEATSP